MWTTQAASVKATYTKDRGAVMEQPLEIEKKYRVSDAESNALRARLATLDAIAEGTEWEENTLYRGNNLDTKGAVLRLRRVGGRGVLTYKKRLITESAIKQNIENETVVADAEQMAAILDALGYRPTLVYEKRRETWHWGGVEIVLDELPFGLFVEIEGTEKAIIAAEKALQLTDIEAVHETYPHLTAQHGTRRNGVLEARFLKPELGSPTK